MTIPGISVTQDTIDYWVLDSLSPGTYDAVIRVTNNSSNNDYRFIFKVVSTIGIDENDLNVSYEVWDWNGYLLGRNIPWRELKGWYIIRYDNGKIEKVFVN